MLMNAYTQMGLVNMFLIFIILYRVAADRNEYRDCNLFSQLLFSTMFTVFIDTLGWLLDGRLTGIWAYVTEVVDSANLIFTGMCCWCWVRYAYFLAVEDEKDSRKYSKISFFIFAVQAVLIVLNAFTGWFFTIDGNGYYQRSGGYYIYIVFCLIQLIYSSIICFLASRKNKESLKKRELRLIAVIIWIPILGTALQGIFYGFSTIWTCMVIMLLLIYIHIQDKRTAQESEQQNKILKDALAQAQYASKAKTAFLSNMSHDIRTPMNAIIGFTAIAASHIEDENIVRDSLAKIMTSSNHLLNLINDVLDMSRIESGKMQLQVTECNLATVMHDLVDMVQTQIVAKQLDLFVDTLHVKNEDVIADPMKLNQVLINLIGNAIKYNKPGGVVSVRIEQKNSAPAGYGHYIFSVKDTGRGIAEEFQKHIFEPFERENDSTKSKVEGTGLGLAIVKNIIDMMGGSIRVTSEPGKGSEFIVEVDLKLQSNPEAQVNYEKLQGLRALVADDDFNTCDSVSGMLEQMGMQADWTLTGKEAVLKAQKAFKDEKAFSAYIIDWLMPDMNGVEVVRRIRSVIGKDIPIFIMTAYDWSDIEEEAMEAGVTAFCRKPLFISELREVLLEAMHIKEKSTEYERKNAQINRECLKGKRILLVEDQPLNREIASHILSDAEILIEEAEDGEIAVKKFKESEEHYYDLVLMDIRMPVMDGYQATFKIRNMGRNDSDLPIIAMTANAFDEDKKMALEKGMNSHLAKPLNVQKLFTVLTDYLGE